MPDLFETARAICTPPPPAVMELASIQHSLEVLADSIEVLG